MTRKPVDPNAAPSLSPQQKTALWLHAGGLDIEDVATLMGIKRPTAKEHLHRAYRNLHVHTSQAAVRAAYEAGLFVPAYLAQELKEATEHIAELEEQLSRQSAMAAVQQLDPQYVQGLRTVSSKLRTMSHVTDGQGLAAELRAMAEDLDAALRALGQQPAESPLDGAERALRMVGIRGVNRVFLGVVLEDHPEVKQLADEWDWSDTEVRDKITQHVIRDMLGLSSYQYETAVRANPQKLFQDFWAAHEKWK